MLAVLLGLGSGLSWGVADFMGGLASRRAPALWVVALSQTAGLALALIALALVRPELPPARELGLGLAGGVCGAVALGAFYRGLAIGAMSLVAPVSALGALVPLTVDLAAGRAPGPLALAGMAVALGGAALAAIAPGAASRRGLGLAVVAALGFGGLLVLLAEAAATSPLWGLAATRSSSAPLALAAAALSAGAATGLPSRVLALAAGAGAIEAAANVMFAAGTRVGLVSVVAVLGSLYPVMTVALASAVLGERLGRLQATGAGAALVGVALIAAG